MSTCSQLHIIIDGKNTISCQLKNCSGFEILRTPLISFIFGISSECSTFSYMLHMLAANWSLPCAHTNVYMVPTEAQHVARISNYLADLIPVGTIVFYDVPTSNCGFQAAYVPRSTFKWVEASFMQWFFQQENLHPILDKLLLLVANKYLLATFKVYSLELIPQVRLWKVRVYAIPLDIDGARYLRLWRRNHGIVLSAKDFGRYWFDLLSVMDFSPEAWNCPLLLSSLGKGLYLVPFLGERKGSNRIKKNVSFYDSFHISRWLNGYRPLKPKCQDESLDKIVDRIYAKIQLPILKNYDNIDASRKEEGVAVAEELIAQTLDSFYNNEQNISGVSTKLYPFQIRSLCKMYEKEVVTRSDIVPNFLDARSPMGRIYYYDAYLPGLYSQPELYFLPRGGILAENMGFGKTLICLSLICLTAHEFSSALGDMQPCRGNYTPKNSPIASLADVCVGTITRHSLPWKFYKEALSSPIIQKIVSLPAQFKLLKRQEMRPVQSRKRAFDETKTEEVYLCSTTLVIVPDNLFHQWNDEIRKHTKSGYLKILNISERFKDSIEDSGSIYTNTVLSVSKIILFDLVIITAQMLSKGKNLLAALKQIYWKRLIVDEGHSVGSKSSNMRAKCSSLHAERRWVVSGTPTSGLTSLHIDEDFEPPEELKMNMSKGQRNSFVVKSKFNAREDLAKLGTFVSQFFKIEPFFTQSKAWHNLIYKGLLGPSAYATEASLQRLLDSLMIKHGQREIQADLQLPKMFHDAVILEPSFHNKLSMNLFTAVLAVNAVASERVGPDYMFSPVNRVQLRQLIRNLQFASFYWTGFQIADVENLVNVIHENLKKINSDGKPKHNQADIGLLHQSLQVATQALQNTKWRVASVHHEMQYFLKHIPPQILRYFAVGVANDTHIFAAPQLGALQQFYYKNRFPNFSGSPGLNDKLLAAAKEFWTKYYDESDRKNRLKQNEKGKKAVQNTLRSSTQRHKEITPEISYRERTSNFEGSDFYAQKETVSWESAYQEFKKAQILGTSSSKLSYLACKLVSHAKTGIKSIVFFETEDNAYFLTELLEVLGVPYLLYANFVGSEERANNLKSFASHDSSQCGLSLIMDLSLAAHGLTIIAATHVYFISPVWQRSVEAQAIKRAHRIGQTQEVHVETLILRGTLEEEMYRVRKQAVENSAHHKEVNDDSTDASKSVIENNDIQLFIMKHLFIPTHETEKEYSEFILPYKAGHSYMTKDSNNDDGMNLESHSMRITFENSQKTEEWSMKLFSRDNLQRVGDLRQEKASSRRLNMELVLPKPESSLSPMKIEKIRKRVKF